MRKLYALLTSCCILIAGTVQSNELLFLSNHDGDLEIYVKNLTTGKTKQLTHNSLDDNQATWSPDGKSILYSGRKLKGIEVYTMSSTGENKRHISKGLTGINHSPSWSPDGQSIVFINQHVNTYSLYVYDVKKKTTSKVYSTEKDLKMPHWSVDGSFLTFIAYKGKASHLHKLVLATKTLSDLTTNKKEEILNYTRHQHEDKLYFSARRSKIINLFEINTLTGEEKKLTDLLTIDTEASVSPDGKSLAFLSARNDQVRRQLFVSDLSAKKAKDITEQHIEILEPSWRTDSKAIVYSKYHDNRFLIAIKDLTSGKEHLVTKDLKGYQYQPLFKPI